MKSYCNGPQNNDICSVQIQDKFHLKKSTSNLAALLFLSLFPLWLAHLIRETRICPLCSNPNLPSKHNTQHLGIKIIKDTRNQMLYSLFFVLERIFWLTTTSSRIKERSEEAQITNLSPKAVTLFLANWPYSIRASSAINGPNQEFCTVSDKKDWTWRKNIGTYWIPITSNDD